MATPYTIAVAGKGGVEFQRRLERAAFRAGGENYAARSNLR